MSKPNSLLVSISRLKEWEDNPRTVTKADFERLKKQIKKFGQYKPLICCPDGKDKFVVLGGNMRLRAYRELGIKKIWISVVNAKIKKERIEFSLSDNDRVGYYDYQQLANLIDPYRDKLDLVNWKVDIYEPWLDLQKILNMISPDDPHKEWDGMPEFKDKGEAVRSLQIHFRTEQDVEKFSKLIKQKITSKTKYIWFPEKKKQRIASLRYISDES